MDRCGHRAMPGLARWSNVQLWKECQPADQLWPALQGLLVTEVNSTVQGVQWPGEL